MSDLTSAFQIAQEEAKALSARPDNDTLLRLYALYKQATVGDVSGPKPGFTDFLARAKFDAWEKARGTTPEQAMKAYIDLVRGLKTDAS